MKLDPEIKDEVRSYLASEEAPNPLVIKKYIERRLKEKKNKILVISGYKLSDQEMSLILDKFPYLKQRSGKIENKIDPNISAGIIIKFSSKVINLTLESKLKSLKKNLYEFS